MGIDTSPKEMVQESSECGGMSLETIARALRSRRTPCAIQGIAVVAGHRRRRLRPSWSSPRPREVSTWKTMRPDAIMHGVFTGGSCGRALVLVLSVLLAGCAERPD